MGIMGTALLVISVLSGLILIVAVLFQTSQTEGFSALGGAETMQYKKGTWDDFLEQITKYAAVIWLTSAVLISIWYYKFH